MKFITYISICTFVFVVSFSNFAKADIFKFEAEDGTLHFTDNPVHSGFKLYMKDFKQDKKLRTKFKFSGDPSKYDDIIKKSAQKYGVSVALVKAVIQAESGYNPNAVSRTGASGLMQLMPKTAKHLKVADSFNPTDNVEGGVKYLSFLLNTFNGDTTLALAAYNAGLGKVAKYRGVPPYRETINYIQRVLSYMQSYQVSG